MCVLIDVSSLLTKGSDSREQERQLRKLIGLRDWMMAVLAFPVGAVSGWIHATEHVHTHTNTQKQPEGGRNVKGLDSCICSTISSLTLH